MKIGAAFLAASSLALQSACATPPTRTVDVLIRGGTIYPGKGEPFIGDVGITGDRIVFAGPSRGTSAARTIDATGMVVAPGFIDPHTHMGADLASDDRETRLIPAFLMQGVTTAFIGNDGGGDLEVGQVLGRAKEKPVGVNYAAYIGLGAVRRQVVGDDDRPPNEAELREMRSLVAGAMCEGALGLSTGMFYAPQSFATTDEVIALAHEAGVRGGIYDSHIRDESSYTVGLAGAIDEALEIGRKAGIPVHISHIKALGVDVQGQGGAIIAKVEAAHATGQKVTADQYPWSASGTSLVASLVPSWAQDGGRAAMLGRFDTPALRERLHSDMRENLRKRGGAESLLITEGEFGGHRLSQVADAHGMDPIDAAIAVIRKADPAVASFNQSEADIAAFMRRPWVMTSSDASTGHPRVYGSFARKYAKYVIEDEVLELSDFIARSTTLTADTFGLADRGRIADGAFADIVVFDPGAYAARATYEQPTLTASGVRAVLVNGVIAVDRGALTGAAAGRALPHTFTAGTCS